MIEAKPTHCEICEIPETMTYRPSKKEMQDCGVPDIIVEEMLARYGLFYSEYRKCWCCWSCLLGFDKGAQRRRINGLIEKGLVEKFIRATEKVS